MEYRFASDLDVLASILLEFGISTPDELRSHLNGSLATELHKQVSGHGRGLERLHKVLWPDYNGWDLEWDNVLHEVGFLKANRDHWRKLAQDENDKLGKVRGPLKQLRAVLDD